MEFDQALPIDAALPGLTAALAARNVAVLVAPPGAGKSTRVPLVLAAEPWASGKKIIVLEPRRLAARAAASRMAMTLGEPVGGTVGYRVRFGSKISRATRIEVVTEGVFTRRVLEDPGLEGVAALLFDEFHERSLDADLGLALARDVQTGLREDLRLVVMSATLDGARVARLLDDAPVIESSGRAFAVETRYLGRDPGAAIEREVVDAIVQAIRAETGSVLAFLPGAAEIRRALSQLSERIADPAVDIAALYGALDAQTQDRAIAPSPPGRRKIVLSTSIAETSLTIEGVRVVVDCGLSRVPRYEPDVGLTRLETVRVSRAAADQRRGRAGRTQPGVCYRLWDAPQTASLEPANRPEILAADLSGFMLDLAHWGVRDPAALDFLDPPPAAAVAEANALLIELGAVDAQGRITPVGQKLRQLPLPPRLARMVVNAGAAGEAQRAADIAVVLTERGLGGNDVDLAHRLDGLRRDRSPRASEARSMAKRWAELTRADPSPSVPSAPSAGAGIGAILALAYPDRIAKNRGADASFLLANGRGARLDAGSALAREPFLAVAEIAGTAAQGPGDRFRCRNREPAGAALAPPGRALAGRAGHDGRAGPGERTAAGAGHRAAGDRTAAVEQGAASMARPRDVPAACGRRRMARPLRRGALWRRRLARRLGGRQARARRCQWAGARGCALDSFALGSAPKARDRGADPFRRPLGLVGADRLRRRGGPEAVDPGAGAVRA
jgi:ATP-dependent helicase HrpB